MKYTDRMSFWGSVALFALTAVVAVSAMCGTAYAGEADNEQLVKRGQYLATAGDCVACHTAPKGKPFAGGLSLATPLGEIVSTNITPSKTAELAITRRNGSPTRSVKASARMAHTFIRPCRIVVCASVG